MANTHEPCGQDVPTQTETQQTYDQLIAELSNPSDAVQAVATIIDLTLLLDTAKQHGVEPSEWQRQTDPPLLSVNTCPTPQPHTVEPVPNPNGYTHERCGTQVPGHEQVRQAQRQLSTITRNGAGPDPEVTLSKLNAAWGVLDVALRHHVDRYMQPQALTDVQCGSAGIAG